MLPMTIASFGFDIVRSNVSRPSLGFFACREDGPSKGCPKASNPNALSAYAGTELQRDNRIRSRAQAEELHAGGKIARAFPGARQRVDPQPRGAWSARLAR